MPDSRDRAATAHAPHAAEPPTALIGLDWGTTSLRSYRLDRHGGVLESRALPWGIMRLPAADDGAPGAAEPPRTHPAGRTSSGFERAFEDACGDWLGAHAGAPVLACGMVGSAQGWREARYVSVPCSLNQLAGGFVAVDTQRARLHIVPGLLLPGDAPDVLRGEETQIVGALQDAGPADGAVWVGLPGTHGKWVLADRGGVLDFATFMTGEVFALLKDHSLLGRTMGATSVPDEAAFARGVVRAARATPGLGLLNDIFSTRSLGLTGELAQTAQADYLSGVLIGHELLGLRTLMARHAPAPRLMLVAQDELTRRYASALSLLGLPAPRVPSQPAARGLWRLAQAAGLVAPATP